MVCLEAYAKEALGICEAIDSRPDGAIRMTNDPREASILLYYSVSYEHVGDYRVFTGSNSRTVSAYSTTAKLEARWLTGSAKSPEPLRATAQPDTFITMGERDAPFRNASEPDLTTVEGWEKMMEVIQGWAK